MMRSIRSSESPLRRRGVTFSIMAAIVIACGWQTAMQAADLVSAAGQEESVRDSKLELVSQSAQEQIQRGFNLAERGAVHSARGEFLQVLRIVAHACDAASQSQSAVEALNAGLLALKEADDFLPRDGVNDHIPNWRLIIGAHRTPVLKETDEHELNCLMAMQQYCNYATEQLTLAGGGEPAASMALYGLGRLQPFLATSAAERTTLAVPKAITFFSASLRVNPRNFQTANELGVLLARSGQHLAAKRIFQQGLQVNPQAEMWHNLASVCDILGESEEALQARKRFQELQSSRVADTETTAATNQGIRVRWVEPAAFTQQDNSGRAAAAAPLRTVSSEKRARSSSGRSRLP